MSWRQPIGVLTRCLFLNFISDTYKTPFRQNEGEEETNRWKGVIPCSTLRIRHVSLITNMEMENYHFEREYCVLSWSPYGSCYVSTTTFGMSFTIWFPSSNPMHYPLLLESTSTSLYRVLSSTLQGNDNRNTYFGINGDVRLSVLSLRITSFLPFRKMSPNWEGGMHSISGKDLEVVLQLAFGIRTIWRWWKQRETNVGVKIHNHIAVEMTHHLQHSMERNRPNRLCCFDKSHFRCKLLPWNTHPYITIWLIWSAETRRRMLSPSLCGWEGITRLPPSLIH